jgi:FkbM family methyltransferase
VELATRPTLDHGWDWRRFRGSELALKWNRRDLDSLAQVLAIVPGRTAAVQAGGNLGVFPKALARVFQTVYTFEPAPDCFAALMANAPEPNIVKLQAALGDRARLVNVSRVRRDGKPHPHEGITHVHGAGVLPMIPLDDLHLPVIDLLYLDLEGYELFALQGAPETIERCRPVIAVEINKSIGFYGFTPDEVRQWIVARGYRPVFTTRADEVFVPKEWP